MCIANFFHYSFSSPWLVFFLWASLYQVIKFLILSISHLTRNSILTLFSVYGAIIVTFQRIFVFQIIVIAVFASQVKPKTRRQKRRDIFQKIYAFCRSWIPSHCFGVLLIALPIMATFTNFQCQPTFYHSGEREFFLQVVFQPDSLPLLRQLLTVLLQLIYIGIVHFCNLSALNYWIKSVFALLAASTVLILFSPLVCACDSDLPPIDDILLFLVGGDCHGNIIETSLNLATLVMLVWFLNRELEMR
jgi:hypothetical protein